MSSKVTDVMITRLGVFEMPGHEPNPYGVTYLIDLGEAAVDIYLTPESSYDFKVVFVWADESWSTSGVAQTTAFGILTTGGCLPTSLPNEGGGARPPVYLGERVTRYVAVTTFGTDSFNLGVMWNVYAGDTACVTTLVPDGTVIATEPVPAPD